MNRASCGTNRIGRVRSHDPTGKGSLCSTAMSAIVVESWLGPGTLDKPFHDQSMFLWSPPTSEATSEDRPRAGQRRCSAI